MEDLGAPIAYFALEDGTPVYDRNAELRERGVVLSVDRDDLPEPEENTKGDAERTPLDARLRRAWDWISGRR
jgi:hypothetical protein